MRVFAASSIAALKNKDVGLRMAMVTVQALFFFVDSFRRVWTMLAACSGDGSAASIISSRSDLSMDSIVCSTAEGFESAMVKILRAACSNLFSVGSTIVLRLVDCNKNGSRFGSGVMQ